MTAISHERLVEITSVASVVAAVASMSCAWLSYALSRKLRNEMKSDETLIVSKLEHPTLQTKDHADCVLTCTLFNKSKRKTYVNNVRAYDREKQPIAITWSNRIDSLGNPENPRGLIGVVDTESLCLRGNMGREIDYCWLEIMHSFSLNPVIAIFDPYSEEGLG